MSPILELTGLLKTYQYTAAPPHKHTISRHYDCLNNEPSAKITKHISSLHDTQERFFKLYNKSFGEVTVNGVPLGRDYNSAIESVIAGLKIN
jgi:hypothetical protein